MNQRTQLSPRFPAKATVLGCETWRFLPRSRNTLHSDSTRKLETIVLLRAREANAKAMRAADRRFKSPKTPAPTATYRGPFGPIEIDVDGDWIREVLPDFSPRSRRSRRLRKLLRLHDQHYAQVWADCEASGVRTLVDEERRIDAEAIAWPTSPYRPRRCSR